MLRKRHRGYFLVLDSEEIVNPFTLVPLRRTVTGEGRVTSFPFPPRRKRGRVVECGDRPGVLIFRPARPSIIPF